MAFEGAAVYCRGPMIASGIGRRWVPALTVIAMLAVAPAAPLPVAAQAGAALVQVDAVLLEPLTQTFTVIGRLVARQRGEVAARIAGPVTELRVQVGDRVRRGDVLAVVDPDRYGWWRDIAAAEVDEGKASLANAEARLAMAEAGVARAEAGLALARQELARLERLQGSVAFSQARLDDQRQQTLAAMSEVDFARAEVQEAVSLIERSRAGIARTHANLRIAADNLAHTEVKAPFDGVVTLRHTEVGAYLDIGAAVVTLVNDRDIEVEADVPYDRLAGLAAGVGVVFRLDDNTPHRATVRAIVVEENSRTRTRPVRFTPRFDGAPGNLADGQSVALDLPIGPPREVVSVHKDAIVRGVDGATVFVVVDGVAERRRVGLGEAIGARFEVLRGLEPGELVVVRGNERLMSGQAVRFEEAS